MKYGPLRKKGTQQTGGNSPEQKAKQAAKEIVQSFARQMKDTIQAGGFTRDELAVKLSEDLGNAIVYSFERIYGQNPNDAQFAFFINELLYGGNAAIAAIIKKQLKVDDNFIKKMQSANRSGITGRLERAPYSIWNPAADVREGKKINEAWPFEEPSRRSDNRLVMTAGRRILNLYNHFTMALDKISDAPEGSDRGQLAKDAYKIFEGLVYQLDLFMRQNAESPNPVDLKFSNDALKYITREYTGVEKKMPGGLVIDDIYSYNDFFKFLQDYFTKGSRKLGRFE